LAFKIKDLYSILGMVVSKTDMRPWGARIRILIVHRHGIPSLEF